MSVAALDLMMIAPPSSGGRPWGPAGHSAAPVLDLFDTGSTQVFAHFCHYLILAAAEAPPAADPAQPAADANAPLRLLGWLLITAILFYFIMLRPQKQKEQAIRDKVNSMKENDRVVTIGGVHGVVTNVQRDVERVTIRVDEATGTKLRVNMSAIARVVTGDEEESTTSGNKS